MSSNEKNMRTMNVYTVKQNNLRDIFYNQMEDRMSGKHIGVHMGCYGNATITLKNEREMTFRQSGDVKCGVDFIGNEGYYFETFLNDILVEINKREN